MKLGRKLKVNKNRYVALCKPKMTYPKRKIDVWRRSGDFLQRSQPVTITEDLQIIPRDHRNLGF